MPAQIHSKRRLIVGLGAVVVLVAGGTAVARAMTSGDGTRYRTATASMGSVEQVLTGVGSISAVNQASVAFGVSGTVATVPVSVGSKVGAGQTLATLATTGLNQSLNTANSALATAKQTLATDQASETESTATESAVESTDSIGAIVLDAAVTPTPSSSSRASGGSKPTGAQTAGASTIKELITQVTAAQKAVIATQQHLDQDLAAAESALVTCQNALTTPTSTPPASSPTTTTTPTATATTTATATATPAADSGDSTCLAAIAAAPTKADATKDQQTRDAAEQTLDTAVQKLEQAAVKAGTASGQPSSGSTSGGSAGGTSSGSRTGATSSGRSTGNSNSTGSTGTGSNGGGFNGTSSKSTGSSGTGSSSTGAQSSSRGTTAGPASAAQLAADQAQIDAAEAQLVVATQNLTAATLTSPLAGTVAAVAMTAGKSAGTSSTITVIGTGQSQVTTTVTLADIDKVKVGDPTTVKVDGISQALSGKVSLIGILNSTSGSSTSYPVTILLDPTSQKLYDGSGASTQIQIAQVSNVLTVPSSAVRTLGPFTSVSVLTNGKPVTTRVSVGAVGSDRTQILTGLKAGQSVVLADLNTPLPTSSS